MLHDMDQEGIRESRAEALRNVAPAVVGAQGRVIRLELIPVAYYGTAAGLLTLLLAYLLVPGAY